jgi:hypothetical protein
MKKFIKIDYNIQTYLFILFFIFLILDLLVLKSIVSVVVYFLIAMQHLISSNRRFFSKQYIKTIGFNIYYGISMLFMASLLSLILLSGLSIKNEYYIDFGYGVLSFGLLGTPVLAVTYYIICHYDYKKLK